MRLQDRPAARARMRRRAYSITSYVGPNGNGKSALMVYDTLPSLDYGRPVLSTVRLLDYRNPRDCEGGSFCDDPAGHTRADGSVHAAAHPAYTPFRDYSQLVSFRDGDVLLDEVAGVASSRDSQSMPTQIVNLLLQLRRRNICLRYTAPAFSRTDKVIREVTQSVTLCLGYLPKRRPQPPDMPPLLWSDRRFFIARTYDATLFDDFEAGDSLKLRAQISAGYWRPGGTFERAYDTLDAVSALGWANDAGLCMACGGKRQHPKCGCSDHVPVRKVHDDGGLPPGIAHKAAARPDKAA